jgi:hypothetical protein
MRVSRPRARFHAQGVDQFLAQRRLRLGMHQQHAVFMQPDLPGLGAEMHAGAQILAVGPADAAEFGHCRTLTLLLRTLPFYAVMLRRALMDVKRSREARPRQRHRSSRH